MLSPKAVQQKSVSATTKEVNDIFLRRKFQFSKPSAGQLKGKRWVYVPEVNENAVRSDINVIRKTSPVILVHIRDIDGKTYLHVFFKKDLSAKLRYRILTLLEDKVLPRKYISSSEHAHIPTPPEVYKKLITFSAIRDTLEIKID